MKAPSFLLVDVGNTRTKWAVGQHGTHKLSHFGSCATADLTIAKIQALARRHSESPAVLACVVPKHIPSFRSVFARRLFVVRGDRPELGLAFNYPHPAEIGADRLAAAVAAHARNKFPVIIIQCGTATAYTMLDANGAVCGGAIAPGLEAQARGLLGTTAQLPPTTLSRKGRAPSALARSTRDAIRSGLLLSFQGGVRETIIQLKIDLATRRPISVLLTGGNAPLLPMLAGLRHEPLLVFAGLRIIGERVFPGHE